MPDKKKELLDFMHCAGFDSIHDVAYINGFELVATRKNGSERIWWRRIEEEGSGFVRLFKGSIKELFKSYS